MKVTVAMHAIFTLFLLLAISLISSFAEVTAEIDGNVNVIKDPMTTTVPRLQGTSEPLWFGRISASFTGVNLQKCSKRSNTAPAKGARCSSKSKTCFFGNQECSVVGPHPETKCVCSSKTWNCEAVACPSASPPPIPEGPPDEPSCSLSTYCIFNGVTDVFDVRSLNDFTNDPLCPATGPLDGNTSGCVPDLSGKSCLF
jgi:hypothetical protein